MKNLSLFIFLFFFYSIAIQGQIRVKLGGTGDGSSWANTYGDLQQAIDAAAEDDEIWIAEGVYKPADCDVCTILEREQFYNIQNNINLLGGFLNSGNPTLDDRDWESHPTILSGNIGDPNVNTENSFDLLRGQEFRIEGLIISDTYFVGGFRHSAVVANTLSATGGLFQNNYNEYRGGAIIL